MLKLIKHLISGFSEIDVEDWKNNTEYEGYYKSDITIKYFWRVIFHFEFIFELLF